MHFEYFPAISECWEGVQNDKREVQAGPGTSPGQAGGLVQAAAVKCGNHCVSSLSGAKRSPETLLKVTLQIHVIGTTN